VLEVLGYVFAGPIATQVLVARWFRARRGVRWESRTWAGGRRVVAPMLINYLIRAHGWEHALEIVAIALLAVLFPVGICVTRSTPEEMGLLPDGATASAATGAAIADTASSGVAEAVRTKNFW